MKIEENLFFLDLTDLLPDELKEKIDILNALICKWVAEENIMPKESAEKIKIEFTIKFTIENETEIKNVETVENGTEIKNESEEIYDNGFIPLIDEKINYKPEIMGDA